jgi:lysophospholipase L1-like esterase
MRRLGDGDVMGAAPCRKLAIAHLAGVGCEPMPQSNHARRRTTVLVALASYVSLLGVAALIVVTPMRASRPSSPAASAQAKAKASSTGRIVFTGSSSIAYWDSLANDMKPLAVVNSAFGGAQYSELLDQLDELVIAYRPIAVVVYAGDNDLAAGSRKTAQSVADDVRQFVKMVHSQLPGTWIYVMSIKPSTARWGSWHKMKDANQLIEEYLRTEDRVQYIDVATPMFQPDGNVPRDLFVSDGLHPSAKCYAMWTSIIKPILLQKFGTRKSSSRNLATPWLDRESSGAEIAFALE